MTLVSIDWQTETAQKRPGELRFAGPFFVLARLVDIAAEPVT